VHRCKGSKEKRKENKELRNMWKWFLCAACMFAAINWFVLPNFPQLGQYIHPVTIMGAIGLSAILMLVSVVAGKK
jgi:hypothetical protein